MMTKTAFIMIAGKPNVGKSTLLNTLLGEKVAIVSRKPQTTRNRITGVLTKGENQYVFTDTPGLHKPKTLLGEYMMKSVGNVADSSDIVLFVVEACTELNPNEVSALDKYNASGMDVILVINKTDRANKVKLAEQIMELSNRYKFHAVVPVSALNGDGVEYILDELEPLLTESVHFFPEDYITDQPERKIFAEIIREKVLRLLDDEIPHGVAVSVEEFKEKKGLLSVRAEIYCERESHKRIIIGKNGAMLKKIGSYAREDAEALFETKVFLDLWVKVKENWRDRPSFLSDFGFKDELE
ncbi:MAG: GTPase Era [Clostridia bacterium]|nr:GTPase Era [Clostridia bacterium]MBR6783522.1 GTPase Era [Clostridia bacterium]